MVITQRKNEFDRIVNEFDRIVKVRFPPSMYMPCEGDITFRTPAMVYLQRKGDIASTQNLLNSYKPIICKLNYSHVIKRFITYLVQIEASLYDQYDRK